MQSPFFKRMCKLIFALLLVITALKILLVGYDIDEQYAVSMAYRMVRGDFPVLDMWEPHQTSGFLAALLMLPFLAVTGGNPAGIVLYLRSCGLFLHALTAYFLYRMLVSYMDRKSGFLITIIYFFSLPKLMFLPEFSNMQIWFLILMILCLLKYYMPVPRGKQACQGPEARLDAPSGSGMASLWYLAGGGCFLALEVLTYPSTVLVAFSCLYYIIRYRGKRSLRMELVAFFGPCAAGAATFILYLLSKMTMTQLWKLLPIVASDGSHSASLAERVGAHMRSAGEILCFAAVYALAASFLYLLLKKRMSRGFLWGRLLLTVTLLGQVGIWLFGSRYPNYPLVEYFFLPGAAIMYSVGKKKKYSPWFSFFIVTPLVAFMGIVLFSNHPLLVSSPFLIPCVTGILSFAVSEKARVSYDREALAAGTGAAPDKGSAMHEGCGGWLSMRSVLILWSLVLLFGKCYMVRTTGGLHYTVRDPLSMMREGPTMGIIADRETVRQYKAASLLLENLPEGAGVFYAGSSSGIYLFGNMEFCTPSTISSPTFDEKVGDYFALHPEKSPEYVICDAGLPDLYTESWLKGYLAEQFAGPVIADDYLVVYRRR